MQPQEGQKNKHLPSQEGQPPIGLRRHAPLPAAVLQCKAPEGRTYWSDSVELDTTVGGAAVVSAPAPLLPPSCPLPAPRAAYVMSVTAAQVGGRAPTKTSRSADLPFLIIFSSRVQCPWGRQTSPWDDCLLCLGLQPTGMYGSWLTSRLSMYTQAAAPHPGHRLALPPCALPAPCRCPAAPAPWRCTCCRATCCTTRSTCPSNTSSRVGD